MFIVLEGPDGSGKTTLIEISKEYNLNKDIYYTTAFSSEYGKLAKQLLNSYYSKNINQTTKIELISKSIISTYDTVIAPLRDDNIVVCDRWVPSFYVYQDCKNNKEARDVYMQYFDYLVGLIVQPDHTFYLEVDQNTLLERIANRQKDLLDNYAVSNLSRIISGYKEFISNNKHNYTILTRDNIDQFVTFLRDI